MDRAPVILGLPDLESLLRPFASFEEDRSRYEHLRTYEGEHGVPANAHDEARPALDAIRTYLEIKIRSYAGGRIPPLFVCTTSVTLAPDQTARLERLNRWIGESWPGAA